MKQKRYWLRGGIIGLLIGIILCLVKALVYHDIYVPIVDILIWPSFFAFFFMHLWGCEFEPDWARAPSPYCDIAVPISMPIACALFYFVIGAAIGGLYGKIKNKHYKKHIF